MPPATSPRSSTARPIRIWDVPLRCFHLALVICIIGAYATAQLGGLWMDWHVRFGLAILVLVVFRVVWGVLGSHHARFINFVRGPGTVIGYLRGTVTTAGHSPLASWSVVLMLLSLLVQAGTGLFATDGILIEGPLAHRVAPSLSDTLTGIHQINRIVLLVLIGLHLLALLWYGLVKRQPLVRAMVTGNKPAGQVPQRTPPVQDDWRLWLRALIVLAAILAVLFVWILPG
ncbi:MAG: cytochrome b/b6 domain-containing protein [Pigmentiphaga sp.]